MRSFPKPILALCAALTLTTACKQKDYDAGNNTIIANNSAALLDEFKSTTKSFTVTAGVLKEIVGTQGTLLRFYPESFRDNSGNIINSGTINIELTEMYAGGEMLMNHSSTNTGSAVLTSGGQVYVKATKDGQEIKANKYGIGFNADRTPTSGPRELFYGNNYASDGIITWAGGDGSTGTTVTGDASVTASVVLPTSNYFMFDSCPVFNWVSCNHTYSGTYQDVTVKVKLANVSFSGNVWSSACVSLSTERVATMLYQVSFDPTTQTGTYRGMAPTGITSNFMVIIPRDKDNWYYYRAETAVTDGMLITATMTKATKVDMGVALSAF